MILKARAAKGPFGSAVLVICSPLSGFVPVTASIHARQYRTIASMRLTPLFLKDEPHIIGMIEISKLPYGSPQDFCFGDGIRIIKEFFQQFVIVICNSSIKCVSIHLICFHVFGIGTSLYVIPSLHHPIIPFRVKGLHTLKPSSPQWAVARGQLGATFPDLFYHFRKSAPARSILL